MYLKISSFPCTEEIVVKILNNALLILGKIYFILILKDRPTCDTLQNFTVKIYL